MYSLNTLGLFYMCSLNTHGDSILPSVFRECAWKLSSVSRTQVQYSSPSLVREHVYNSPSVSRGNTWTIVEVCSENTFATVSVLYTEEWVCDIALIECTLSLGKTQEGSGFRRGGHKGPMGDKGS
jgi:hypothetical protein